MTGDLNVWSGSTAAVLPCERASASPQRADHRASQIDRRWRANCRHPANLTNYRVQTSQSSSLSDGSCPKPDLRTETKPAAPVESRSSADVSVWISVLSQYRIEMHTSGQTTQRVPAAVREAEAGAGDEIAHRARHQRLARRSHRDDAGRGVNGDATDIVFGQLDLAGMQSGAHRDAQGLDGAGDRCRATHSPRRAVERREEAIAQLFHLSAAEPPDLLAYCRVMAVEQHTPLAVAELGGALRRVDDVGEHDRRQHAIDLDLAARAGEKFLDFVGDSIGNLQKTMVISGQLDVFRAGNVLSQIAAGLDVAARVAGSMHDERRHADRRQDRTDINLGVHTSQRDRCRRAGARPLPAGPMATEVVVGRLTRHEEFDRSTGSPSALDEVEECL